MKRTILTLIAVATFGATLNAQSLYEGFDYTVGSNNLNGQNGGTGFSAAWNDASATDNLSITSGSIVPSATMRSGYGTSGNKVGSPVGAGANLDFTATRAMTTSINLDSDSTLFFSFLVLGNWTTLGSSRGFNVGFTGSATGLSTNAVTIKKDFNTQNLISAVGGNNVGTSVANGIVNNTATLIIGKLVTSSSGNDTLSMISYAGAETVSATETWDLANQSLGTLAGTLGNFAFSGRVNDTSMRYSFDEFRLGSSWDSVTAVPEPSTVFAALGLAGLMLWPAVRRLRQRATRSVS